MQSSKDQQDSNIIQIKEKYFENLDVQENIFQAI